MCLYRVSQPSPTLRSLRRVGVGYKIYYRKPGSKKLDNFMTATWLSSSPGSEMIRATDSVLYTVGYHVFTHKKDAIAFRAWTLGCFGRKISLRDKTNNPCVMVRWSGVLARGTQKVARGRPASVVVVKKILSKKVLE